MDAGPAASFEKRPGNETSEKSSWRGTRKLGGSSRQCGGRCGTYAGRSQHGSLQKVPDDTMLCSVTMADVVVAMP